MIFLLSFYLNTSWINAIDIIKSIAFLVINFACIIGYFSVKEAQLINPFKKHMGWGDLIFLIGVIPMFTFRNYMLFFITGMIFTLTLYGIFYRKYSQNTIPLAGYLSLYIIVLVISDLLFPINIFYGNIV
ncbi:hypothetical protein N7U66_03280 [Lacinutrix neustonica]|uniref:Prepilin type IV endopeptidase peptidase domain-containing protein n=1 Tax=Lacinutrix neustonica TaxID=2980107 RepID=A0A9E8MW49_9FLAO|nr:hypothetical protein [Lacinutrix neustonica]WAC02707.1 hypothetical protein N7U66_03280 [Lacinutrix neustonica]